MRQWAYNWAETSCHVSSDQTTGKKQGTTSAALKTDGFKIDDFELDTMIS